MQEKENILRIFQEAKDAVDKGESARLSNLSNQTINAASLTHDSDNIAVALVIYSLSKIMERDDYKKLPNWDKFYNAYVKAIDKIISALKKDNEEEVRENLRLIRTEISNLSGKLKEYIKEVFRKAKINKASRIYEHGISMEKTAKLLGITLYELASYAGQREEVPEAPENKTTDVHLRIKLVKEMFE